jgi:type IV secretory pathway VirB2 component (pilin)
LTAEAVAAVVFVEERVAEAAVSVAVEVTEEVLVPVAATVAVLEAVALCVAVFTGAGGFGRSLATGFFLATAGGAGVATWPASRGGVEEVVSGAVVGVERGSAVGAGAAVAGEGRGFAV